MNSKHNLNKENGESSLEVRIILNIGLGITRIIGGANGQEVEVSCLLMEVKDFEIKLT